MEKKLPSSLNNVPIVETILDFHFESNFPEEVLAGMLYADYKEQATSPFEKLPSLQIPEQIRKNDPNLRYVPLYRITLGNILIQVGSQSISVVNTEPYLGWGLFVEKIQNFITTVKTINVIDRITRIGLRYINFVERDAVEVCNISLNRNIEFERIQVNSTEIYSSEGYLIKVQIANGAKLSNPQKGLRTGSVIDLDVYKEGLSIPLELDAISMILKMHEIEKTTFVAILKPEFLEELGPKYE